MSKLMAALLAVLLGVAPLGLSGCAATPRSSSAPDGSQPGTAVISSERPPDELVVCVSGMVTPDQGLPYYQGLCEYVAKRVGLKLRLIHKAEYAELNRLLQTGQVDMAFSCSGPYVTGHDSFGLELLAAPVVNDVMTYQAYIIVPVGSDATSFDSLKGQTFAFTDPESNTGCLVPTYMLAIRGTTPEEFFGRVIYTYSHDKSIESVARGEVAGAAVDSLIWEYTNATDPTYTSKTKVVEKSELYGIPPVVVRPDLDPELKKKLQAALLGASADPEGQALLEQMRIQRFEIIDDSAYRSVREMVKWIDARGAK